jgi:CheY-like chemotaxis protein
MAAHQVLVVEDDEEIRESLLDFLEEHGYQAVGAVHGRDALDKLGGPDLRPCLIVLDLMMPVMDGGTFRNEQLRDPKLSGIPVVVISAYKDVDARAEGLGTVHLKKPLDLRELLKTVQEHCPS